ncbi:MAG: ribonuclease P protein component [Clostridiales bacterium]|jgi:ribonuclease P protein component|nr:ribonuclease P protein component [Clostridiales bacterium]
MKKSVRLKTIKENHIFSKVYSKGKSCSGKYLVLYCYRNYARNETQIGITVSKSRGNAVVRNRTRRRIKEILRLMYPFLKEGFFIVVVAKHSAVTAEFSGLSDELYDLLKKASLFGTKG